MNNMFLNYLMSKVSGLYKKHSELKGKIKLARKMSSKKLYFPEIRNYLSAIPPNVALYVDDPTGVYAKSPKGRREYAEKAYDALRRIDEHYATIPFDKLNGEQFLPLFKIKGLLPEVKKTLDQLFDKRGIGEKETETMLTGYINEILKGTTDYGVMLKELGQEIRNNPLTIYFRINLPNNRGFLRGVKRDAFNN